MCIYIYIYTLSDSIGYDRADRGVALPEAAAAEADVVERQGYLANLFVHYIYIYICQRYYITYICSLYVYIYIYILLICVHYIYIYIYIVVERQGHLTTRTVC